MLPVSPWGCEPFRVGDGAIMIDVDLVDHCQRADRVKFELVGNRHVEGRFDRIVSVGMFEHVGVPQYRAFFLKCRALPITRDYMSEAERARPR